MKARQMRLYNYLIEQGDVFTPQVDLARELYADYGNAECCLEPKDYHNTTERTYVTKDIAKINRDPDFEKIIISTPKGVKIANEEEFDRFIKAQYRAVFKRLKLIRAMEKKGRKNAQIDIDGNTVEAFLGYLEENY